jgi:uncharacterized protein (DUF924 family)
MAPGTPMERVEEILRFWFWASDTERRDPRVWFVADAAFDQACQAGFLDDHERAAAGELNHWRDGPRSTLALILLLDQLPRNMFRGTPRAYATDSQALSAAQHAVARGFDRALIATERVFVYLPFEHSENLDAQREAVRLLRTLADQDPSVSGYLEYAERYLEIIRRFGRFPHRNAILGRTSTPEEAAFLASSR